MVGLFDILVKLNPWWSAEEEDFGFARPKYNDRVNRFISTGEIVIVNGIRRSGKTTLLKQSINALLSRKIDPNKVLFVNFDEPDIVNLKNPVKEVLEAYSQGLNGKGAYLFFDEIQSVKGWEKYVKSLYDEKKHHIVLSGSSSKLLESRLAGLLSGRYLTVKVTPLDFEEYLQFNGVKVPKNSVELSENKNLLIKKLGGYLNEGGFPRVVLQKNPALKKEHLNVYYESIVYKDILLVNQVRQPKALRELLYYLVSNFTSEFTYDAIGKNLGIDYSTTKEYLGHILDSKMLFEVNFFSYSLKAQSRNPKKSFCIDNGLRNAVSFKFSEDLGRLAENLVFVELKRRGKDVYYWKGKNEVDFVVKEKNGALVAVNVTYGDDINEREINALNEFREQFAKKTRKLVLITKNTEKKEGKIIFIPLWKWLLKN